MLLPLGRERAPLTGGPSDLPPEGHSAPLRLCPLTSLQLRESTCWAAVSRSGSLCWAHQTAPTSPRNRLSHSSFLHSLPWPPPGRPQQPCSYPQQGIDRLGAGAGKAPLLPRAPEARCTHSHPARPPACTRSVRGLPSTPGPSPHLCTPPVQPGSQATDCLCEPTCTRPWR